MKSAPAATSSTIAAATVSRKSPLSSSTGFHISSSQSSSSAHTWLSSRCTTASSPNSNSRRTHHMMMLLAALLLASMMATAADAMRIHPAMQMREEGAGAYAADNDDDADGFVSGALRSWLVAPPLAASDISDDRLLRLQGGSTESEEEGSFSRLMHNIDEAKLRMERQRRPPTQPRLLLAPPQVEIAEPWQQTSRSVKSSPRKRSNGGSGLNLSILNNMDVLRNKLLRELMARNQQRNSWSSLSNRNQAILDDLG